jgi:hypothetical protein
VHPLGGHSLSGSHQRASEIMKEEKQSKGGGGCGVDGNGIGGTNNISHILNFCIS